MKAFRFEFFVYIDFDAVILTSLSAISIILLVLISFLSVLWFSEKLQNRGVGKAAFGMP